MQGNHAGLAGRTCFHYAVAFHAHSNGKAMTEFVLLPGLKAIHYLLLMAFLYSRALRLCSLRVFAKLWYPLSDGSAQK